MRVRRWVAVGVSALLTGAALAVPGPAVADPPLPEINPTVTATVWADRPTTAEYTVTNGWTVNSAEGDVVVRRTATGAYTVVLKNAATTGGVAHAVAYGGGPVICTVNGWYRSLVAPDLLIQVRCFAAGGAPVDSRFVATFTNVRRIGDGRLAWFVTDQAVPVGLRTLPATHRYDSLGDEVRYERLGTGHYRFHITWRYEYSFPMTHVTAVSGTAVHCQVGWPDSRDVWCENAAGIPVDARFAVTFGHRVDLLGHSAGPRFHTGTLYGEHVDDGPLYGDQWNSTLAGFDGGVGTHLGTGRYQMRITGTGTAHGTAFANAFRNHSERPPHGYCVLVGWGRSGANTTVTVQCYTGLGVPANINVRVSYTTWPSA